MSPARAHRISKTFYAIARNPNHPSQHRNAINQTAAKHRIPEQRVHTALFITSPLHVPVARTNR